MHSKKNRPRPGKVAAEAVPEPPTFWEIKKDVQSLVSQHSLWKERNQMERQKIVQLGALKPKGDKKTLAAHQQMTKKKKERELRQLQENLKLGLQGGSSLDASHSLMTLKHGGGKRKPEEKRALKFSEGHFKGGVLNVKHLLQQTPSAKEARDGPAPIAFGGKGKKRKGGGKTKGKRRR